MRKVWKTVYFQYSKFQKGHNSYKNWRHSNLICRTIKQSHVQFQLNMSKHVWEKYGKLWWTDGWRPGRMDRHHHTIIRPVWRRAYKKCHIWIGWVCKTKIPKKATKSISWLISYILTIDHTFFIKIFSEQGWLLLNKCYQSTISKLDLEHICINWLFGWWFWWYTSISLKISMSCHNWFQISEILMTRPRFKPQTTFSASRTSLPLAHNTPYRNYELSVQVCI